MEHDIRMLLEGVRTGAVSVDDAEAALRVKPFEDLGYANVDLHRQMRQGAVRALHADYI